MNAQQHAEIIASLSEMGSHLFQMQVWAKPSTEWVSSYVECASRIFDDSGLHDSLRSGEVYGEEVDELLRVMDKLTDEIDSNLSDIEIMASPAFLRCSQIAQDVLPFVILRSGVLGV